MDAELRNAIALAESESGAPSPQTVPDFWPNVPLIAINRYPLFPGFIKKVDVRVLIPDGYDTTKIISCRSLVMKN